MNIEFLCCQVAAAKYDFLRFQKFCESIRKVVECINGILKKRFALLKRGVHSHNRGFIDNVVKTACCLHNFILQEDGLAELWQELKAQENADFIEARMQGAISANNVAWLEKIKQYSSQENSSDISVAYRIKQEAIVKHWHFRYHRRLVKWMRIQGEKASLTLDQELRLVEIEENEENIE